MTAQGFTLFETRIGRCGIAWGERGVMGVQHRAGLDAVLRRRGGEAGGTRRGARWQPYRTVASWYRWRALELKKA